MVTCQQFFVNAFIHKPPFENHWATELETQLAPNQRHCEHLFQRNEVQFFMNKVKTHYRKERGKRKKKLRWGTENTIFRPGRYRGNTRNTQHRSDVLQPKTKPQWAKTESGTEVFIPRTQVRRLRLMKGEAQATGEGDGSDYSDRDRQLFSHWFYSDFLCL